MPTPVHVRRQIREAVGTLLTGLTTTGSRVLQSRMRPRDETALPALLITTNDETVEPGSVGALQQRTLTLQVLGIAKSTGTLDDTLDAMALEVETAMAGAPSLGGLAAGMELRGISVAFDDDLNQPVGVITLDSRITYFVLAGSPGSVS
jgi:hypothetical protein